MLGLDEAMGDGLTEFGEWEAFFAGGEGAHWGGGGKRG
jgi:predicted porin